MRDGSDVRLVVFDIGGVLIRVVPWREAHEACGLPAAQLPPLDAFQPALSRLNHAYDRGDLQPQEFETAVAALADGSYSIEDVHRIHAATCRPEFPGIPTVFDQLEGLNLDVGVLSNTNRTHWQRLAGLADGGVEYPTIGRAKHLHASFLLRCAKPDRAIYDAFTEASGTEPQQILFFDDLEPNVLGARGAGWRAEQIDPTAGPAQQVMAALRRHGVLAAE